MASVVSRWFDDAPLRLARRSGAPSEGACPACGVSGLVRLTGLPRDIAFAGPGIFECPACRHRFLPTTPAQQVEIERAYGHDYEGYAADAFFGRAVREEVAAHLVPRVPPPARVLDVGSGAGEFLLAARAAGYDARGVDVSDAAAAIARSRGVPAESADFLTHDFGGTFDVISMWDVVEHLREPSAFLSRARELLSPRGVLLLKVPGFRGRAFLAIGAAPRLAQTILGAPAHIQYFCRQSLEALLDRTGFHDRAWLPQRPLRDVYGSPARPLRFARRHVREAIFRPLGSGALYLFAARGG
ncbi:MAG TPA: class I SAM-dependent methyltransferase [Byssovorax sp.]|jgi:2-polyprenyl-3-methyl-5-hydroxy-6-metoxy-1,4-benzoquinol methylase